jgi:Ca2+-binding RTX toxin-like protein
MSEVDLGLSGIGSLSDGGKLIRPFSALLVVAAAALIATSGSAGAAMSTSTVGQNFAPTACTGGTTFTALQFRSGEGNPYTVAAAGAITSWSFQTGSSPVPGLKLKVARPQSPPASYLFIGESAAGAQTPNAVNTYPANIPVQAGDIIGIYFGAPAGAPCYTALLHPNDDVVLFDGDPPVNTMAMVEDGTTARIPVSATVTTTSPDAPSAPSAICRGIPATIVGTPGNDVRTGTPGRDVMLGLEGNDTFRGLAGNDVICGAKGNDALNGGKGRDTLLGQNGSDKLKGGPGKDKLSGKKGKDRLQGAGGNDKLKGGGGKDICIGGEANDSASKCEVEKSI